jgi:hypothetical protein
MKRNTLAEQVRKLPPPVAFIVAKYGYLPSPIKLATLEYLEKLEWAKRCKRLGEKGWEMGMRHLAEIRWEELQFHILEAIQDCNPSALRMLARTVEDYKFELPAAGDKPRMYALWLESMCEAKQEQMSIAEVAKSIGWNRDERTLRRILKDIRFPLRISNIGRPKKQPEKTRTRKRK